MRGEIERVAVVILIYRMLWVERHVRVKLL